MGRFSRSLFLLAFVACTAEGADLTGAPKPGFSFFPLPVLYYTPETKTAFGATMLVLHRPEENPETPHPSVINPVLVYTQKSQVIAGASADLYLAGEAWRVVAGLEYQKYPDLFYGIGPDSPADAEEEYTDYATSLSVGLQKRMARGLYAGPRFQYMVTDVQEVEEGGLLDGEGVRGADGGTVATAGWTVTWDLRNHPFVPSGGFLVDLAADIASDRVGSEFEYSHFQADVRLFFPGLAGGHTVGVQGVAGVRTGEPPFQLLTGLGDASLLRGYHARRFIDRNKVGLQGEYRMPVWGRLGAVFFAGFGDVAHDLEDLKGSQMKHSVGWGLRYGWRPEEKINVRFDIGYGVGEAGAYIALTESF